MSKAEHKIMCGNVEKWKCGFPLIVPLWLRHVEISAFPLIAQHVTQ